MPFSLAACQAHFESAPWFDDPANRVIVARFFLPLECCPTLNRYAEMNGWARAKVKKAALDYMAIQYRQKRTMLTGKPLVRAIRFSSVEPDTDSSWMKVPVDRLTGKHGGLGLIKDDKPSQLDRFSFWHTVKPGGGYVVLELLSDRLDGGMDTW